MSLRRNGCLTMRGNGGDVIMKAIQREDCYQPTTDAQKVPGGGHCRLWTYGASAAAAAQAADTPYCDCYRGVCAPDGAAVTGNCDESPKNTVVVTSTVVPSSLPVQPSFADVIIASTAKDVDSRTDPTVGLDASRTTDLPRPRSRGASKEEEDTYNRRPSPFQPLHQVKMVYDDHLYQTSGLAYRYSMQLARGIHAPAARLAECLDYSKDGSAALTDRPDDFGFTGSSMNADKDSRSNDCPTSG